MKKLIFLFILAFAIASGGCDKTGALKDPVAPASYVAPTISNLQVTASSISKCAGGIMRLTCEWTSPGIVSTATAYLSFVKTIQDVVSEPVGVIASDTTKLAGSRFAEVVTATDSECLKSDPVAFYNRFKQPIAIPTKVGTSELAGMWSAEIPLPKEDIISAPLGIHQMVFYMSINGVKTNTLSFETTFVP